MKDIKLRLEDIIRGLKGEDVSATLRDALEYIRLLESRCEWYSEDDGVWDRAWADDHPFDFGDS
jgi:hypothetical protein